MMTKQRRKTVESKKSKLTSQEKLEYHFCPDLDNNLTHYTDYKIKDCKCGKHSVCGDCNGEGYTYIKEEKQFYFGICDKCNGFGVTL